MIPRRVCCAAGVAPRAKMNQQRSRRFKSALERLQVQLQQHHWRLLGSTTEQAACIRSAVAWAACAVQLTIQHSSVRRCFWSTAQTWLHGASCPNYIVGSWTCFQLHALSRTSSGSREQRSPYITLLKAGIGTGRTTCQHNCACTAKHVHCPWPTVCALCLSPPAA